MKNREVYRVLSSMSAEELDQEFLVLDENVDQPYGKPFLRTLEEAKNIISDHLFDDYVLEKFIDINSIIEALEKEKTINTNKGLITEDDLYGIVNRLNFGLKNGLEVTKNTRIFILGDKQEIN